MAGAMGGDKDRALDDLVTIKTPWYEILREFMNQTCRSRDGELSYARANRRRMGDDDIYPTEMHERIGEVVFSNDTSGSISQSELTVFLSHVVTIMKAVKPEKAHVLYWDTKVAGHEVYLPSQYDSVAKSTQPKGGGGTEVNCIQPFLKEKRINPKVCVILSDGYLCTPPKPFPCPTIWVIKGNPTFTTPNGDMVIHLPDNWTE